MKAWRVRRHGEPAEVLRLEETGLPEPGPGHLRVAVHAAALALPDVLMCRGSYPIRPPLPFTPGQEVAGTVTAAGPGTSTPPGARVLAVTVFYEGSGGFAEQALVLEQSAFPVPDAMPLEEAAVFGIAFHTAWIGLVLRARIQPGEVLLVHGAAGGTGSAAVQLGHALGARVIAVVGGPEKKQKCIEQGAARVVDHRSEDFGDAVRDFSAGHGADVIYDPVGGEVFARSLGCIANGGRLLAVGFASGSWGQADTSTVVHRNCAVMGVYVGAHGRDEISSGHEALLELWRQGRIRAPVDRVIGFSEIPQALGEIAARAVQGRLVARLP